MAALRVPWVTKALFTRQRFRLNPHRIRKHCVAFAPSVYTATVKTIMIYANFWIREQKRKDLSSVVISSSCKHSIRISFATKMARHWATAAFLALLTGLVGLCKLVFATASLQSYAFIRRRQRIAYNSQLPIRKRTRSGRRVDSTGQDPTMVEELRGGPCFTDWMEGKL